VLGDIDIRMVTPASHQRLPSQNSSRLSSTDRYRAIGPTCVQLALEHDLFAGPVSYSMNFMLIKRLAAWSITFIDIPGASWIEPSRSRASS